MDPALLSTPHTSQPVRFRTLAPKLPVSIATDIKHRPADRRHVFEHFRARAFKILFAFRSESLARVPFDSDFNCPVARPRARRNGVGCARHFPSSQTFRSDVTLQPQCFSLGISAFP